MTRAATRLNTARYSFAKHLVAFHGDLKDADPFLTVGSAGVQIKP